MRAGLTDASYNDIRVLISHTSISPANPKIAFLFMPVR